MRTIVPWFAILIVLIQISFQVVFASSGEIDEVGFCDRVIDGDTFDISSGDRIRLADIDAPEYGEIGYAGAKDYLEWLIYHETVYLDIDDIYETDPYGRLVCVVYVKWNLTHYLNVNEAMIAAGHAWISNYYNEFNPYSWTLYVHENEIPEFPSLLFATFFLLLTSAVILVYRRFFQK